jgi:nucleoside-diphosphate-sugar epimerase
MVSEDYRYNGEHISEYDRTKWKAHYEVALPMMKEGLPLVIVQPGVVYGPGDENLSGRMIDRYLKNDLPMLPKVTAWCWAHVDDIADGHIAAMEKGRKGESYIIAGEEHTIIEAMEIAQEITGIKPPKIKASPWLLRLSSRIMVPVSSIFNLPSFYRPETLRVSAGVTYLGSNEKARKELGYSPRTLEEGFREYLPQRMRELKVPNTSIPG